MTSMPQAQPDFGKTIIIVEVKKLLAKEEKQLLLHVDKARWWCLQNLPFYGSLTANLIDKLAYDLLLLGCNTAATDGKSILWFPPFLAGLNDKQIRFVLLHETLHCAHLHPWRLPHDERGNAAGDYVINAILKDIPGIELVPGVLYNPQFNKLAEEEVLRRLPQSGGQPVDKKPGDKKSKPNLDPGGCGGFLAPDDSQSNKQDDKKGDKKDDKKGGKQSDGKQPWQGKGKDEKKPDGDKSDGKSGNKPESKQGNGNDNEPMKIPDSLRNHWERAVEQAAMLSKVADGIGELPGDLETIIKKLRARAINWRDEATDFTKEALGNRNDWTRSSSRHAWQQIIYPRRKRDEIGLIVFVRDVSGSVSDEMLGRYTSWVDMCLAEIGTEGIVIDFDSRVRQESRIGKDEPCPTKTTGRGGTSYTPVINRIKQLIEDGERICGTVFITDGHNMEGDNIEDPGVPFLWLLHKGKQTPMPFGRTIVVMDD